VTALFECLIFSLPHFHLSQFLLKPLQCNEIRKMNSNLIIIGKTTNENDKEDFDEADDDDPDNAEESEGEEFEQETG
jgi:hypothetical protein